MQSWWISPHKVHFKQQGVTLSIPEHQRRIDVKYPSGQVSNEKALRICWAIGDNTFTFKIKLDDRPLAKRVMLSVISSIHDPLGFFRAFVSRMYNGMLKVTSATNLFFAIKYPLMCN